MGKKKRAQQPVKGKNPIKAAAEEAKKKKEAEEAAKPRLFAKWTGKTPVSHLHEFTQKQKRPKPQFREMKRLPGGRFRYKVIISQTSKLREKGTPADCVLGPTEGPWTETGIMARHAAAVAGLHYFKGNTNFHLQLPQELRPLWTQLKEQALTRAEQEKKRAVREAKAAKRKEMQEKHEKRKEHEKRSIQHVHMAKGHRDAVEDIIRDLHRDGKHSAAMSSGDTGGPSEGSGSGSASGSGSGSGSAAGAQDVDKLVAQLGKMGFGTTWAMQAVMETNAVGVDRARDWLLLHVPEHELPKEYRARNIGIDADKQTSGTRQLTDIGFHVEDARAALDSTGGDLDAARCMLMAALTARVHTAVPEEELPDATERAEMLDDELDALRAICGDGVRAQDVKLGGTAYLQVRVPLQLNLRGSAGKKAHLEVLVARTGLYPCALPLIALQSLSVPSAAKYDLMLGVLQDCTASLGSPMVYNMVYWLQSNATDVLAKRAKRGGAPPCLIAKPQKQQQSQKQKGQQRRHNNGNNSHNNNRNNNRNNNGNNNNNNNNNNRNNNNSNNRDKRGQQQQRRRRPVLSEAEKRRISDELLRERESVKSKGEWKKMAAVRARLPAAKKKALIADTVRNNQVTVISGETGCGKSTQVPQFVLEDMIDRRQGGACNIICTQPRRIAALGLAKRVSQERADGLGGTVGYQIRLESKRSARTRLTFVTTGILLRRLAAERGLDGVSHVIVDEVHERSLDSDFLLALMKQLLRVRPDIRLVLMSATIDATGFSTYFGGAPVLHIPGFTHPVKVHNLREVVRLTGYRPSMRGYRRPAPSGGGSGGGDGGGSGGAESWEDFADGGGDSDLNERVAVCDQDRIDFELLGDLVAHIDRHEKPGAILVFLPGLPEINKAMSRVNSRVGGSGGGHWVLPLHSMLSTFNQERIFSAPPHGVRKIILATNIAETSITIDDVVYVIDTGKHKEMQYDPFTHMSSLTETWVSRANAKQRSGRAGRVRPGKCFRLYTAKRHDALSAFQQPEMLRVPLEQLCLQVKIVHPGPVHKFLHQVIQPPSNTAIATGVRVLTKVGAFDEREDITPLGRHLANLPVDIRLGKMLIYGSMLGCIDPVLTICAGMSLRTPFISPPDKRAEANAAHARFAVGKSDHLTLYRAYNTWLHEGGRNARGWCDEHFLSLTTLRTVVEMKASFAEQLSTIGFLPRGMRSSTLQRNEYKGSGLLGGDYYNRNARNHKIIRAVLCAGLYPNVIRVQHPPPKYHEVAAGTVENEHKPWAIKFYDDADSRVFVHPASVNFSETKLENGWLVYKEKIRTSKVFIRDSTMVSPYALLLFGGKIAVQPDKKTITVDGWIRFFSPARIAVLVRELRSGLDDLLSRKISDPESSINDSRVVEATNKLIATDGF